MLDGIGAINETAEKIRARDIETNRPPTKWPSEERSGEKDDRSVWEFWTAKRTINKDAQALLNDAQAAIDKVTEPVREAVGEAVDRYGQNVKDATKVALVAGAISAGTVAAGGRLRKGEQHIHSHYLDTSPGISMKVDNSWLHQDLKPASLEQERQAQTPRAETPKKEHQQETSKRHEKKKVDVYEIRAQLVNKLLYGLTDTEFMKINEQIDQEMKGRHLKHIDGILEDYGGFIRMNAAEYKIPDWVIFGMLATESRFDPTAVSEADAVGIAQITKIAGEDMGIYNEALGMDLRDDPGSAIEGLAKYVRKYRSYFAGDTAYGIQAYKTGPGDLQRYATYTAGTEKDDGYTAAQKRNVYSVINEVTPKDPADKSYIARVIGHAAEYLAYLQENS